MIQLSIFDADPAHTPLCKDCQHICYELEFGLCLTCLRQRPQRADGSYLTARIYPHDWRADPQWQGGRSFPLYYRDEAGVIWEKKHDITGEYQRWQG